MKHLLIQRYIIEQIRKGKKPIFYATEGLGRPFKEKFPDTHKIIVGSKGDNNG